MALNLMSGEGQGNQNDKAAKCTSDRGGVLPSSVKIPALVHALNTHLTMLCFEHLDLLKTTVGFISATLATSQDRRFTPVHTTSHFPRPLQCTLLLKIYCLLAEQLLDLVQDGLEESQGNLFFKTNLRKGNSLIHTLWFLCCCRIIWALQYIKF